MTRTLALVAGLGLAGLLIGCGEDHGRRYNAYCPPQAGWSGHADFAWQSHDRPKHLDDRYRRPDPPRYAANTWRAPQPPHQDRHGGDAWRGASKGRDAGRRDDGRKGDSRRHHDDDD